MADAKPDPQSFDDSPLDEGEGGPGYRWYVVAILLVIYVFSFVDRQIMSLMVGPIKKGLGLEYDWQVGILGGPAFAVFYAIFGIPFGRLADRVNRRSLIAFGLAFWSLMTAGCGIARSFVQMALFRVGVGVGEASLSPSAYSLITDTFPKRSLATALSVYGMGIYIGSGMAYLIGGAAIGALMATEPWSLPVFGVVEPWQKVFIIVGLPGLLILPVLFTIKEPARKDRLKGKDGKDGQVASLGEVISYFRANASTMLAHNLGFALLAFSSYGSAFWLPAVFKRTHQWEASDFGFIYGIITMIFGIAGIVVGGWLADRMRERGRADAKMLVGLIAAVAWFPSGLLFPLVENANVAMVLVAPTIFFAAMPFGVAPAALQELMPNSMRGQASALYLFVVNLLGLGIGPTFLALMTDYVFGESGIRYSLVLVTGGAHVLAALALAFGLGPYRRSLATFKERVAA